MRVQFLNKARQHVDATQFLSKLAKNLRDRDKRLVHSRQKAYCTLVSGDADAAILILHAVLQSNLLYNSSQLLSEKAQEAKQAGIITARVVSSDAEDEYGTLFAVSLGLSRVARRQLEHCKLREIDTRPRESGVFNSQDIRKV